MTETVSAAQSIAGVLARVKSVGKDSRNAQQGFNFRGIDAVMNAVNPALKEVGGFIVPNVADKQTVEVGTTKNGATIFSVRLTVEFTWYGTDGSHISGMVPAEANDSADKATAKAMSVAYRTFLLQTLCLPTDDPDPDEAYIEAHPARNWKAEVEELAAVKDVAGMRELWVQARDAGAPQAFLDGVVTMVAKIEAAA